MKAFRVCLYSACLCCCGFCSAAEGNALVLDHGTAYASISENASLDLGAGVGKSFTLEGFFCLPTTSQTGYADLVAKDNAYELGIQFQTDGFSILHFAVWATPGIYGKDDWVAFIQIAPGWHHIAAIFSNSSTGAVRTVFMDGRRMSLSNRQDFPSGISASPAPVTLGTADGTNGVAVWLDEVRLSDIARYTNESFTGYLTPYRIPTIPFAPDAHTVALWHFDEPPGSTSFGDASGNGNHLVSVNGATTGPPPVFQTPGTLDQTFYPGLGTDDDVIPNGVYALGIQTNGQILIGGQFSRVDGLARICLARLNPDGSVDPSFSVTLTNSFFSTAINAILVLPNNQFLIGGSFTAVNGVARIGLARLNPDGALDTTFGPVLTDSTASVNTIIQQPDGKLIIGGSFFSIGSTGPRNAARLNPNGTLDSSFDASSILWSGLERFLLQPDGKLLCLVSFSDVGLQAYTNVIRLNSTGSWDTSFRPILSNAAQQDALALQPDGKLLYVGGFDTIHGVPRAGAARFLTNGALDDTFNLTNSHGTIYTNGGALGFIAVQADGKILLAGQFYTGPSTVVPSVARFLPDGSWDPTFQPAEFYEPNNRVYDSAFLPSGKILIAGEFIDVNGYSRRGIARLYGDPMPQPPQPRFLSISPQPPYSVRLEVTNPATQTVVLQTATNLNADQWLPLATNALGTNRFQFVDTNAWRFARRFYRAYHIKP